MSDMQKAIEYFDGYGSPYDDLVITALEKQVPKNPILEEDAVVLIRFPRCARIMGRSLLAYNWNCGQTENKYCKSCGQRIDWETDNEECGYFQKGNNHLEEAEND